MQLSKVYLLPLFLNINICFSMDAPVEQGQLISALKDIQIRLNARNLKEKEDLSIDSVSPFDITPNTITRKNLGSLNRNNLLSLTNEKLEFDTGDGRKTIVSALHIHPENKKNEGLAIKLSYNRDTHNFDFHLEQLNDMTLKRIASQTINLKQPTKTQIPTITLDLELNSDNWPASKLHVLQQQITTPSNIPAAATGKGKTLNKLKFWKK